MAPPGRLFIFVAAVTMLPASALKPVFDGVLRFDSAANATVAYMRPPFQANHASTIEVLPDGTLAVAWFSGLAEEAPGCAIVFATLPPKAAGFTNASVLSQRANYSNQNPVLFYDNATDLLHLFHSQAPANSGEGQSEIWHLQSNDRGRTWTEPTPLITGPGAFPRNRVIPLLDDSILFPIYNASSASPSFKANYAIMAKGNHQMQFQLNPVPGTANLVQPTVVRPVAGNPKLVCFFRDRRSQHIYRSTSNDDGATWANPAATELPNNNAGIEANLLLSGRFALVYNPTTSDRNPLRIALSSDEGLHWGPTRDLQNGNSTVDSSRRSSATSLEFSYPSILQTADGQIHITFTYNRDTIKYMRITEDWVAEG